MQFPSGPAPHTAFGGSATDLVDEDGQNLLASAGPEAAPSPPPSPILNTSAEQDKGLKFGPADRSCDHFWPLSIRPFDLSSRTPRPRSLGSSIEPEPAFHHINFLGEKIYERSATPPEVSYWAAFLSTYTKPHQTFSRKGVITAQANKFIDPFRYIPNGSESAMEELCGSDLLAALDGRVEKAYPNRGSWLAEREEDGDEAPICFDQHDLKTEPIYYWTTVPNHGLHRPHRMHKRDQHDMVINGPRNFTSPASRSYKNVARKHLTRPSGLRKIIGSEEQKDLVDEVDAWGIDRSQWWYANFATKTSRLSSVMAVDDHDVNVPVEADTSPNPTSDAQGSVGPGGVELGAEELAAARRELEMLGMDEDSDSSDSEDDDFYDDNIEFSDEDEDSPPCARKCHVSIHVEYPASEAPAGVGNFPPMQLNGPPRPSQPVAERVNNGHPIETMHDFSEEGDVGLLRHSNHGAEFVHHPLPLPGAGAQITSSYGFEATIPGSTEEGLVFPTTSANPIQQQDLLLCAAHVETIPHETSDERRASHQNFIEQRPQHLVTLANDDSQAISNLRSTIGSFSHNSLERIKRIQHWLHDQQQQLIRPGPEEKHQVGCLKFTNEERKAAAMLTASALEQGDQGVRDIKRGARYSRRSTIRKKDKSYLDNPIGGVLWFLFLFVCFLYLWDLLP